MRKIVYLFASVGLLCLGTSCAKRSEPADALSGNKAPTVNGEAGVVLAYGQGLPVALVERVEKYAEANLPVPVHTVSTDVTATTAAKLTELIAPLRRKEDVCVIGLITGLAKDGDQGHVSVDSKAAVLSFDALKATVMTGEGENLEEQFGRCLEKETLRSVGLIAGLKTCINPLCCMSGYETREQLMMKGRNYCPPCGIDIQDLISGK